MSKYKKSGLSIVKDSDSGEADRLNFLLWNQSVASQHAVHATLAGLSVTALTLFASFNSHNLNVWQKRLFVATLIAIIVQVVYLVYMSDHERRDSYPYGDTSEQQRKLENKARYWLKISTAASFIFIAVLLTYTVLKA